MFLPWVSMFCVASSASAFTYGALHKGMTGLVGIALAIASEQTVFATGIVTARR